MYYEIVNYDLNDIVTIDDVIWIDISKECLYVHIDQNMIIFVQY